MIRSNRKKKCKECGKQFMPHSSIQKVCSQACALKHVRKETIKKEKKRTRMLREELKTLSEHAKDVQVLFNQYIRLRDAREPCISCKRYHSGQYHAGHYRTVGAHPELRFNLWNVHKQCSVCNNHLSGNIADYRINLVAKIGREKVEWLEQDHPPKRYTREDYDRMKKILRKKLKKLKQKC